MRRRPTRDDVEQAMAAALGTSQIRKDEHPACPDCHHPTADSGRECCAVTRAIHAVSNQKPDAWDVYDVGVHLACHYAHLNAAVLALIARERLEGRAT